MGEGKGRRKARFCKEIEPKSLELGLKEEFLRFIKFALLRLSGFGFTFSNPMKFAYITALCGKGFLNSAYDTETGGDD